MNILSHPNPILGSKALEVDPLSDASIHELAREMGRLMYEAPGIGLAAPQVGVMKRVIVFDLSDDEDGHLQVLCNPVITHRSSETVVDEEGCLSLPGITVPVERPSAVRCTALDESGTPLEIAADGLLARLLQHEIDHLDGVLIIDRATTEERLAALRRYRDMLTAGPLPRDLEM